MAKWNRPPTPPPGSGGDDFGDEEPSIVRWREILEARVQRLELRDANHFGVNGDAGAWQRHEEEDNAVHEDVKVLNGFRAKFLLLAAIGGSVIGVVAEVVSHLIEKGLH